MKNRFLKTGDDAKKKYGPNWMEVFFYFISFFYFFSFMNLLFY